jgi:hypothetical protein
MFVIILASVLATICPARTNDIAVSLHMPWEKVLLFEEYSFAVTITNNSDRVIPLVKNSGAAQRFQVKFDIGAKEPQAVSPESFEGTSYKFVSWGHRLNNAPDALMPGQTYTWEFQNWNDLAWYCYKVEATNITARVMTGDNEWVCSKTIPFNVSKEKGLVEESPIIGCYDANTKTDMSFRQVKLGNKSFLFTKDGNRVCETPNDETPKAFFDSEKGLMVISFPKSMRTLLYDPKTNKVVQERHGK